MATPKLRVGLVGAGMVSRHHLAAWAKIAEAEVVAIADPRPARGRERAAAFGIDRVFEAADHLIDEMRPDVLDIAAPVEHHGDLCRLAADRGIAVLCQKPLAGTFEDARSIVHDVAGRVRFMIHENWRFRPPYRRIKSWIDDQVIGDIGLVRLSVRASGFITDADGLMPGLVRQPFLASLPRFLVFELLVHHLDVLRWLIGPLAVSAAHLGRLSGAIRAEDTAAIALVGPHGLPVLIDACYCVHGAPDHVVDNLEIIGTKGTISLSDTNLSLTGARTASMSWAFDTMYGDAYEGALREFVTGLLMGRAFETEAEDNLHVLQLVEDIYAAAGWS